MMRTSALLSLCLAAAGCGESKSKSAAPATAEADKPATPERPTASKLLPVGAEAPDFTKEAHTGQVIRLSELRGKPVVLYFYPKDDTPG